MKFLALGLLFFTGSLPASGPDFPGRPARPEHAPSYFRLHWENDAFLPGTDQKYTNGNRLEWFRRLKQQEGTGASYLGLGITQTIYTPSDHSKAALQPGARPYAGVLLASIIREWTSKEPGLTVTAGLGWEADFQRLSLQVGLRGPGSQGEAVQKKFHHLIEAPQPQGWQHQMAALPALMAEWQGQWTLASNGWAFDTLPPRLGRRFESETAPEKPAPWFYAGLGPRLNAVVGLPYTWLQGAFMARLGLPATEKKLQWLREFDHEQAGRDILSAAVASPLRWFRPSRLGLVAGCGGRLVGFNGTLEDFPYGGAASPATVRALPLVWESVLGLEAKWLRGQLRLEYTWRSTEFESPQKSLGDHQFWRLAFSTDGNFMMPLVPAN